MRLCLFWLIGRVQMQRWGSGYVTDIEYTDGYYPPQEPGNLALTAAIVGLEPPDLSRRFTYCELGCGRGATSLVLAACHPNAEFHAVDFLPAHIAHAEARARAAGLDNITFHERSFEDLTRGNAATLPMFDMVTLHGVWSWVGPEVQRAVLDFLSHRVKPGGAVYLSYNTMPGWSVRMPLQRLLKELTVLWPGRSDVAAENAVAMLRRLADAKVIPEALHDGLKKMTEGLARRFPAYLAHEYLNEYWQPVYHADVARAFAEAKLNYAGSTDLLRNFVNLGVTAEQRKLLDEIPVVELKETLRDYFFDYSFRHDVYVRGARRMTEGRRNALLSALRLTLVRPTPEEIEIVALQTAWRPDPDAYRVFLKALQRRPHSVAELLSMPDLSPTHSITPAELVGVLIGTRIAAVHREAAPEAQASCERFNQLIEADGYMPQRAATLAVPSLGGGINLPAGDFALYLALKGGKSVDPHELAKQFVKRCKEEGGFPVIDGKTLEDETEAHVAVARDYSNKLEFIVPIWRMIGLLR
jgi:hypothetical protein